MNDGFLDTNVFIRHLLQDHPDHSQRASQLIGRISDGEIVVRITDTVVFETVFVLNQIYHVPRGDVSKELTALLSILGILIDSRVEVIATLGYWAQQLPLSFADCYHLIAARSFGLSTIYSFDKKMGRYPGVERIEP